MEERVHYINPELLTLGRIGEIMDQGLLVKLTKESETAIKKCRQYLSDTLTNSDALHYGINTGFGSLCNVQITKDEVAELQINLVKSHAAGTGDLVPQEIVKIMLLLKVQSLSYGFSGVPVETVEKLMDFFNYDIIPIVFQQGSLGASGDLAPLAHLSLPLFGLGEVWANGRRMETVHVMNQLFWKPLDPRAKEGLALLNGTQFSSAYGVWCMLKSQHLLKIANLTAALSVDAYNCRRSPFDARIHSLRAHPGQVATAETILHWLKGSEFANKEKHSLQDPYAFRCTPQVHGASTDALHYVEKVLQTEINSVTDNPSIFPDTDAILSGGNFHAQPLALALDFLAIALSELGSISERRTFNLMLGKRSLPDYLCAQPGIHSGLMIAQYTAASIASQNKQLCTPASVDSIVSSNGQEDHVSMAANAATKAYRVVQNLERILAIEFMSAAQAMEFRRPWQTSPALEKVISDYRKVVPVLEEDRVLSTDIQKTIEFLRELKL